MMMRNYGVILEKFHILKVKTIKDNIDAQKLQLKVKRLKKWELKIMKL